MSSAEEPFIDLDSLPVRDLGDLVRPDSKAEEKLAELRESGEIVFSGTLTDTEYEHAALLHDLAYPSKSFEIELPRPFTKRFLERPWRPWRNREVFEFETEITAVQLTKEAVASEEGGDPGDESGRSSVTVSFAGIPRSTIRRRTVMRYRPIERSREVAAATAALTYRAKVRVEDLIAFALRFGRLR